MKLDYHDPYRPEFLKDLRTRVGMSQPELGKLAGFSRDDIANFERGLTHIAIDDAVKLYDALATVDQSGDAIAAALLAATSLTESRIHTLKSAKREVIEKRKYVDAARRWLQEAKANERRIRALKEGKKSQ